MMLSPLIRTLFLPLPAVLFLSPLSIGAMMDADCLNCHGNPTLIIKVKGKVKQLYVKNDDFVGSVHANNGCISCHPDAKDFPHLSQIKKSIVETVMKTLKNAIDPVYTARPLPAETDLHLTAQTVTASTISFLRKILDLQHIQ